MADFANEPIPLHLPDLPVLNEEDFEAVEANYLRVSLVGMALFASVVVLGGVAFMIFGPGSPLAPLAVMSALIALIALAAALRAIEVRHMAYQVRDHDISYRSGVLIRTVASIPFVRVQHARIRQGPVQRRFDLATVEINSAGPDLRIAGLSTATAERLRSLVVERAGALVEEL